MRIARISHRSLDGPRYASVLGSAAFPLPTDFNFERADVSQTVTSIPLDDVTLLAPVVPSKIVCVGRNYREHAAEFGNKMPDRSEEHTSELQSPCNIVCRLLHEK